MPWAAQGMRMQPFFNQGFQPMAAQHGIPQGSQSRGARRRGKAWSSRRPHFGDGSNEITQNGRNGSPAEDAAQGRAAAERGNRRVVQ